MQSEPRPHRVLLLCTLGVVAILLKIGEDYRPVWFEPMRSGLTTIAEPSMYAGDWLRQGIETYAENQVSLEKVRRERDALLQEVRALREAVKTFDTVHQENHRLACLLDLQRTKYDTIAARVVGRTQEAWFRSVTIDRGTADGIQEGDAVIHPEGVVGQVVEVHQHTCRVQLLTDEYSGIAVYVQTHEIDGILQGQGSEPGRMKFFRRLRQSIFDEYLYTSGLAGTYPRDVPVGRVIRCESDPADGLFQVLVEPAVDFDRLREVLVVPSTTTEPPKTSSPLGDDHVASR